MSKRRLRTLLVSLIILAASAASVWLVQPNTQTATVSPTIPAPGYYRIAHFTDGDTLSVDMNGTDEAVRFIGIDTPETKKPDTPVQCYGPEASNFTKQTIGAQPVRLEADPTGDNRDRYNRLLRYVYLPDGTLLNRELIAKGYAFAYTSFPFTKKADFVAAQTDAQQAKLGLWGACQPKLNGDRWQSNDL